MIESTVLGGQAGTSRRIENYLGFPAGISGTELTSRAITQARKFGARTATPYRATALEPGDERHLVRLEGGQRDRRPRGRARHRRRIPAPAGGGPRAVRGDQRLLRGRARPRRSSAAPSASAVVGGGNSAAQAAVWLARGGALVTLLHRRADLAETMSHYLIAELERFGVAVRDRSEIAELARRRRAARGGDAHRRHAAPLSFLFLFLGAEAVHRLARRRASRATSTASSSPARRPAPRACSRRACPGVYAAGDVRSGSTKRCATAVGEGAAVVRSVHEHITAANVPTT